MPLTSIPKLGIRWAPVGKTQGTIERDLRKIGGAGNEFFKLPWSQAVKLAADRWQWCSSVSVLCVSKHEED